MIALPATRPNSICIASNRPLPAPLFRPTALMLQIIAFAMTSPMQTPKQKHKNDSKKALSSSRDRSPEAEKQSRKIVITRDRMNNPRMALDAARHRTPMDGASTGNLAEDEISTPGLFKQVKPIAIGT